MARLTYIRDFCQGSITLVLFQFNGIHQKIPGNNKRCFLNNLQKSFALNTLVAIMHGEEHLSISEEIV